MEASSSGPKPRARGPVASVRVFIVAAPIYFVWEMAQAPLFTGMPRDWRLSTAICALATIADLILLVALVAVGAILFGDERWFAPPRLARYAVVAFLGLAAQMVIE